MLSFTYQNTTNYIFGHGEYRRIGELLAPHADKVLLHYGGGSIVRSGLYREITESLRRAGIAFAELGGVKPNPEVASVRTGIEICRREGIRFILAVGGGSVIDSAKAIAAGTVHSGDVWKLYTKEETLAGEPLPVAVVLTLPAAGSENSPNTVLSEPESRRKLGYRHPHLRPHTTVVSPELFLTLPPEQMAYGASDMLCHIFERYFSNTPDTELSDALCEATMRTILQQALILRREPQNEKAWAQLALSGTLAHNNLLGVGREQSWACHALEHELSAVYDVPHGAGLAVIVPRYLQAILPHNPALLARWAVNVMGVCPGEPQKTALAGILRLQEWYTALKLPRNMQELGIPEDADFRTMAENACHTYDNSAVPTLPGVYRLNVQEATELLQRCC